MVRKKTEAAKKKPAQAGKKEALAKKSKVQTIKAATHTGAKTALPKTKTIAPASDEKVIKNQTMTFPIVGIGASAGGLEALEGFFSNMPDNSNLAVVIIQHLAPKYKSIMATLLNKYTTMKILEIDDGMRALPNCVYLNTPGMDVAIMNRTFQLIQPLEPHASRLPIDFFFRSLADDLGEKAICIVLSGTGTDGAPWGLKQSRAQGE
ncbi:MAG: chemotaxis protein CheB [Candidatus Kuenenia stuttgartiensis]|nr:chemotaxis protein CheB [Candidatus Kuenenia stuttgartiensis]